MSWTSKTFPLEPNGKYPRGDGPQVWTACNAMWDLEISVISVLVSASLLTTIIIEFNKFANSFSAEPWVWLVCLWLQSSVLGLKLELSDVYTAQNTELSATFMDDTPPGQDRRFRKQFEIDFYGQYSQVRWEILSKQERKAWSASLYWCTRRLPAMRFAYKKPTPTTRHNSTSSQNTKSPLLWPGT